MRVKLIISLFACLIMAYHTAFSQPTGLDISGVEIAASAFANLLEDMPVEPLSIGWHLAAVAFWGALITILCLLSPAVVAAGWSVGLSLIYIAFAHFQFKHSGFWHPIVIPIFFQVFFHHILHQSVKMIVERVGLILLKIWDLCRAVNI